MLPALPASVEREGDAGPDEAVVPHSGTSFSDTNRAIESRLRYACGMTRRKSSRNSHPVVPDAEGLMVGEMLRQTVRDQIKANEPPEVAATYRRLIMEGHDKADAIELITAVLAAEMYDIMNEQRDFDEAKYNMNLRRLPELPYESDA